MNIRYILALCCFSPLFSMDPLGDPLYDKAYGIIIINSSHLKDLSEEFKTAFTFARHTINTQRSKIWKNIVKQSRETCLQYPRLIANNEAQLNKCLEYIKQDELELENSFTACKKLTKKKNRRKKCIIEATYLARNDLTKKYTSVLTQSNLDSIETTYRSILEDVPGLLKNLAILGASMDEPLFRRVTLNILNHTINPRLGESPLQYAKRLKRKNIIEEIHALSNTLVPSQSLPSLAAQAAVQTIAQKPASTPTISTSLQPSLSSESASSADSSQPAMQSILAQVYADPISENQSDIVFIRKSKDTLDDQDTAASIAYMLPTLEMAGTHLRFINNETKPVSPAVLAAQVVVTTNQRSGATQLGTGSESQSAAPSAQEIIPSQVQSQPATAKPLVSPFAKATHKQDKAAIATSAQAARSDTPRPGSNDSPGLSYLYKSFRF